MWVGLTDINRQKNAQIKRPQCGEDNAGKAQVLQERLRGVLTQDDEDPDSFEFQLSGLEYAKQ